MANELHDFEKSYREGWKPWDSGVPSAELLRVLDAGLLPGRSVLELGCGTGTNTVELARRGYTVTAIDFVAQALQTAREMARTAGVAVEFRVADVTDTKFELGGPFDVLFDRGVYHHIRRVDLGAFLHTVEKASRRGTRWLSLAGNAKEQHDPGPPTVSEPQLRAELEPLFEVLELREFRFGTDTEAFRPLAWSILMQRK